MAGGEDGPSGMEDYLAARRLFDAVRPSGAHEGAAQLLERVCRAALDSLGLLCASVGLVPRGLPGVVVVADGSSAHLGELQLDAGEGPGLTAVTLGRPVLVSNLAGPYGDQWPGYRHAAIELGVAAVFVFPLHLGAVSIGTFELFSGRTGALAPRDARLARALAEICLEILLDNQLIDVNGELSGGLPKEFVNRASIAQAQGMVMVDLGVTLSEAIARMRAHAFTTGVTLTELAHLVIAGYSLTAGDGPIAERDS